MKVKEKRDLDARCNTRGQKWTFSVRSHLAKSELETDTNVVDFAALNVDLCYYAISTLKSSLVNPPGSLDGCARAHFAGTPCNTTRATVVQS